MARKSKGTSQRKGAEGQQEWTMAKKRQGPLSKGRWTLTFTGKQIANGRRVAISVFAFAKENPQWREQNSDFLAMCKRFLKDPGFMTPKNAVKIMREFRQKKPKKSKDVKGQRFFNFE